MIYEYAVDPALLTAWAKSGDVGLAPQFGLDHRRVVADLPDNWDGLATGTLLETFEWDCSHPDYIAAQSRLDALLAFMRPKVRRSRQTHDCTWLKMAMQEHDAEPFHAILTRDPIPDRTEVITPEVVQDLRNERWYLPTIDVTSKTASALAAQLAPLLRAASQIILVDPYFGADKAGYPEVLEELFLQALSRRATDRPKPDFTVMSGVGDRDRPVSGSSLDEQLRKESLHRCGKAQELLPRRIPKGITLRFICIAEFEGGDQVHNRLLLTDVGGAIIPYGTQTLGEQVFDDITPMYAGQHRTRWRQYAKGDGLTVVGQPVTIVGTKC